MGGPTESRETVHLSSVLRAPALPGPLCNATDIKRSEERHPETLEEPQGRGMQTALTVFHIAKEGMEVGWSQKAVKIVPSFTGMGSKNPHRRVSTG